MDINSEKRKLAQELKILYLQVQLEKAAATLAFISEDPFDDDQERQKAERQQRVDGYAARIKTLKKRWEELKARDSLEKPQ